MREKFKGISNNFSRLNEMQRGLTKSFHNEFLPSKFLERMKSKNKIL